MLIEEPLNPAAVNKLSLEQLAFVTCCRGWPRATYYDDDTTLEQAFDYYKVTPYFSGKEKSHEISYRRRTYARSYL